MWLSTILAYILAARVQGFVDLSAGTHRQTRRGTAVYGDSAAQGGTEEKDSFFASEGWTNIARALDEVPVFTVADEKGMPLTYQISLPAKNRTYTVPFFYCDVDAAVEELEAAKNQSTETANANMNQKNNNDIDIIPFPLGKAFKLWAKDQAVIVPSKEAVRQAGAPPNANPIGQQVPLFACMEIAEEGSDGKPRLPLFLSLEDANAAIKEAAQTDKVEQDSLEVACLSLNRAIDQLAANPESMAFRFLAPSKSMEYIRDYLS